jgi:hypothetical protein
MQDCKEQQPSYPMKAVCPRCGGGYLQTGPSHFHTQDDCIRSLTHMVVYLHQILLQHDGLIGRLLNACNQSGMLSDQSNIPEEPKQDVILKSTNE